MWLTRQPIIRRSSQKHLICQMNRTTITFVKITRIDASFDGNAPSGPVNPPGTPSSRVKSRMGFCKDFLKLPTTDRAWARQAIQAEYGKQERQLISMNLWIPKMNGGGGHRLLVMALVIAGLLAWLWPIGAGGKMPVGGDVSSFFLGLMGVLSEALKAGRLPVWNDLWGYGFPGIGESQMGVFYPPHLALYRMLATERAYVASLVLHTLWGGAGAWWAARRFGVSPVGAGLAAFAFSASGFFVIHMPHPWGYTTGSWMPWAWGLSWLILASEGWSHLAGRLFLLSLVLVLQILPGHFQIAFLTQSGIALMAIWFLLDPSAGRERNSQETPGVSWAGRLRRLLPLAVCLAMVFPLAALQLWPTARLAGLASAQRDFEYLSGFAVTPLHLVTFVAPGLFHRSALWRPLVWDPFHTSPEELLVFVGLAPLFLAILEVRYEFRRDPVVRMLAMLAAVSLVLSLGPYVPGFRLLIELPGFSFFRAPARWTLATSLALAVLAGKGLDRCRMWDRPGRSLVWLAGLAAGWIIIAVVLIELAMLSGSESGSHWLPEFFQRVFQARPWSGDPDFFSVLGQARKAARDPRIPAGLIQAGVASLPADQRSFLESRGLIYGRELGGTAGVLAAIAAVSWISTLRRLRAHPTFLPAALIVLSFVDLLLLGQHRLVSVGPLRSLGEQSPVVASLAQEPRGTRIVDSFHNLSMLVGLEPISAYRTLDLPALQPLTVLAQAPLAANPLGPAIRKAMRACGVGLRVLDPVGRALERSGGRSKQTDDTEVAIDDPALAGWLFGPDWVAEQGAWSSKFRIIHSDPAPSRAWFLPLTVVSRPAMLDFWSGDLEPLLELLDRARPLRAESRSTLGLDVAVDADGPGWVIVSQLADPQWVARWSGDWAREERAEVLATFRRKESEGGWQRVRVPGAGRQTLHLDYVARDVTLGLRASALAWVVWGLMLFAVAGRSRNRSKL